MASAYPDSKTFRGIKIGDTISNLFSAYDSKYFSVQVGYDDTTATDAQKKLVEMYNARLKLLIQRISKVLFLLLTVAQYP